MCADEPGTHTGSEQDIILIYERGTLRQPDNGRNNSRNEERELKNPVMMKLYVETSITPAMYPMIQNFEI